MAEPLIYIVEGPAGSGKSQLAPKIAEQVEGRLVHHGPYPTDSQPWHRYAQSLIDTVRDNHQPLVMDRSWLSELIYGRTIRSHARFDEAISRSLERVALSMRTVVINCTPDEIDSVIKAEAESNSLSHEDSALANIQRQYRQLNETTVLPIFRCNQLADTEIDDEAVDSILNDAEELSADAYPEDLLEELGDNEPIDYGLIGNPYTAQTILLSDKSSPFHADLPFFGLSGCSPWLSNRLAEGSYTENDLCWFNVRTPDGVFKSAEAIHAWIRSHRGETGNNVRIFPMGAIASAWAESERLPVTNSIKHPQAHKRFESHTYPLVKALENDGL